MRTATPTASWTQNVDGSWSPERSPGTVPVKSLTVEGVSGAPSAALAVRPGLYYFRSDTPTVANQRIYVSTAIGVWTGII